MTIDIASNVATTEQFDEDPEVRWEIASATLRQLIAVVGDLRTAVGLSFRSDGLHVQTMDASHACCVCVHLQEASFEDYTCTSPVSLGLQLASLAEVLAECGPDASLVGHWQSGSSAVSLQHLRSSGDGIASSLLELVRTEIEYVDVPELRYSSAACVPAGELLQLCRALTVAGGLVEVSGFHDELVIRAPGHAQSRLVLPSSQWAELPVVAQFSLKLFTGFAETAPQPSIVQLRISPGTPLSVQYICGASGGGTAQFHLVPLAAV